MKKKPQIVIVGAGPAGTSLAIRLAFRGISPVLIEREKFPRQKLCGEFISPECLRHFSDLGVSDSMLSAGGDNIFETRFYEPGGKSISVPSKLFGGGSALSLSRARMDLNLLDRAKALGITVLEETKAAGLLRKCESVWELRVRHNDGGSSEIEADIIVDATGRAGAISKLLEQKSSNWNSKPGSNSYVGFKTHLQNVNLDKGRCEIYSFRGGYGGLSCIEDGLANLCFLVKSEIVREFESDTERILNELIFKNKRACETLKDSKPAAKYLAVAVDSFGLKNLSPAAGILALGDSAAFIDPFTGSGMLMAFESAEILADCISRGNSSFEALTANYHRLHKETFSRRLRISSLLRRVAFSPYFAKSAISILSVSKLSRELLARATRQSPKFAENKS
ncbi:MAG: NAD(P)/FAD-dependent oxidoreductase [Pyrinomonadaceae bacterium]